MGCTVAGLCAAPYSRIYGALHVESGSLESVVEVVRTVVCADHASWFMPGMVADAHVSDAWTCDYLSVCLVSVIIYHAQMQVSVYISYADDMLVNVP